MAPQCKIHTAKALEGKAPYPWKTSADILLEGRKAVIKAGDRSHFIARGDDSHHGYTASSGLLCYFCFCACWKHQRSDKQDSEACKKSYFWAKHHSSGYHLQCILVVVPKLQFFKIKINIRHNTDSLFLGFTELPSFAASSF